jgi:hypothetical protein
VQKSAKQVADEAQQAMDRKMHMSNSCALKAGSTQLMNAARHEFYRPTFTKIISAGFFNIPQNILCIAWRPIVRSFPQIYSYLTFQDSTDSRYTRALTNDVTTQKKQKVSS